MPYKSDKQRRFFEGCRHDPKHMKGECPDEKTLGEFHHEDSGRKRAVKRMKREKG